MTQPHHKRTPRIAAIVPSTIASCQIGVLKPLSALDRRRKIELRHSLESKAPLSLVHWADLVVFCRNTEPAYAHLLSEALSTSKPIVFDLDDNFWDVPFESDPELARYHRLPLRIQQLEKYLTHANLVRVYSPDLKAIVERFNKKVRLFKAGFDFALVKQKLPKLPSDKVRIVYATSRIVDNQYLLFGEAIRQVLQQYGERVDVTVWGCQPAELVGVAGVSFMPLIPDYERFLRVFAQAQFDIGLAPLEDTPFHRSKTNTKFRDYGGSRVAGIYSNVCVYSSCVENDRTGVLVDNNTEAWKEAIGKLIDQPALRRSIQENAFKTVYEEYRQEVVEAEWLAQIEELLSSSTTYSITSNESGAKAREVLVRADYQSLSGIRCPASSPGDNEPIGAVALEVLTPERTVLREAASTKVVRTAESNELHFSFAPIRNSRSQEYILRFIRFPEESMDSGQYWFPTSAYIQMTYS